MLWRRPQKFHRGLKLYNSLKHQFIAFQTLISLRETQKSALLFTSKPAIVCLVVKSCPTLFVTPRTIATPSSSVHEISQARVLEWVAVSFFKESSNSGSDRFLLHCRLESLPLSLLGSPTSKPLIRDWKCTQMPSLLQIKIFKNDLKSRISGRGKEEAKIHIQYKIIA